MRSIGDIGSLGRQNWLLTAAIGCLLTIGVLFVYSSCFVISEQYVRSLWLKQIVWAAVGIVLYLMFAMIDYRRLGVLSWWAYGVSVLLLVLVLLVGTKIYGAKRWIMLFGIGVQPSELAKVSVIFVLARVLSRPGIDCRNPKTIGLVLSIVALPFVLVGVEPDLGTAMIFIPIVMVMMFVAGVPTRVLMSMVGFGVFVVAFILGALFLPQKLGMSEETQDRFRKLTGIPEYQKKRIEVFINPDMDPLGAGWNERQSKIAIGSGGMRGRGWKNGKQNKLGYLPRKVAPTDFIYSVLAEETGFIGSVVVLSLFGLVVTLGLATAIAAWDQVGRLLCVGIVAMFFCHAFINIAMTIGLMPITGLPLPLLSYGGSFMLVTMSAMGVIQSVYIRSRRIEGFR